MTKVFSLCFFVMMSLSLTAMAQTNSTAQKPPLTPAQKVTKVYANHVLSGLCAQDYVSRVENPNWTAADRTFFWKRYQTGCKCLATEILTVADPADVVDFARNNYGTIPTKKSLPVDAKKIRSISVLYNSPIILRKCNLPE